MARDHDWDLNHDDNHGSRERGRDDYGRDGRRAGSPGRYDEGRSWQGSGQSYGGDRYDGEYGERAYSDRVQGRGRGGGGGGHSLESFARGRGAGAGVGQRGYGQIGVGQNPNDQGGVGQGGFSQAGTTYDDRGGRDFYGADGGARGAYSGYGQRSGGRDRNEPMATNPYLADITEGEHRGRGPKNYTRSDDRIAEDVSDRLSDAHDVDASDIEVTVQAGEVTLSGTVDDRRAKRRAEDVAEEVSGVRHVQNNLRVKDQSATRAMGDTLPQV